MSVIEAIRVGFMHTCVVGTLERRGCRVSLRSVPANRLRIDLDLPGSPLDDNAVRCDHLVFVDDNDKLFVAAIEFKGVWRKKVVDQLQAGARKAERHVAVNRQCDFRPIGVFERVKRARQRAVRRQVVFRGVSRAIRVVRCGGRLIEALSA